MEPAELDFGDMVAEAADEPARVLTLRERLLCRHVEAEHHYYSGPEENRWVPAELPFGWGVAYWPAYRNRIGRHGVVIAPFPLNVVLGLGVWAYRRLFLAPLISTGLAKSLIARETRAAVEAERAHWEAAEEKSGHAVRRGRAAEVALYEVLRQLADAGIKPETAWVDGCSMGHLVHDLRWKVEQSEDDPDVFRFERDTPVADRPKQSAMPPIDMDALRVGGAYEQRHDDEF